MDFGRNNRPIYEIEYSPSVAGKKRCRTEEFQTRVTMLLPTMMMFFYIVADYQLLISLSEIYLSFY